MSREIEVPVDSEFKSLRNLGVLCVSCGFLFQPITAPRRRERGGCAET